MPAQNFEDIFEQTFAFSYTNCDLDVEPDIFPKKRRPNPEEGFQLN